jgi:threonine dehydratase
VVDLDPTRITAARAVIDPVFQHSPQYVDLQLSREVGRTVVVKDETRNPVRSFKGRGACFLVANVPAASHVVCTSSGNFGQGIAYACRSRGLRCTVFLSEDANPIAVERIRGLGADTRIVATASDRAPEAKSFAAATEGGILVEDARDPASAEGAGTIGLELREAGHLDAIIVPVGDGALISGVACAVKEVSPSTRIIGACPAAAPSVAESWRAGAPTRAEAHTIADGLSTTDPIPASVTRMRALVDDMVLVGEGGLVEAMRLGARTLGALLEPSGAAGLAALLEHDPPGERVAVLLTGSMARPEHLALLSEGGATK